MNILSIFVILEITSIYFYKISLLTYIIDFFNKKEKFENDRLNFYLGKNLIKHKHVNINNINNNFKTYQYCWKLPKLMSVR